MATFKQKFFNALATVGGLVVLIPFCYFHCWRDCDSSAGPYPAHKIDEWYVKNWPKLSAWLNSWAGNREDGVSAIYALIWGEQLPYIGTRVPYLPNAKPGYRAWAWSAWRNSANELHRKWGT